MKKYFIHWNLLRLLRLGMGIAILIQAIYTHHHTLILMGIIFTLMPIFNIGCCGANGCTTSINKTSSKQEEITYEEIH